jgi:hypothetical protein
VPLLVTVWALAVIDRQPARTAVRMTFSTRDETNLIERI